MAAVLKRAGKPAGFVSLGFLIFLMAGWGTLALFYGGEDGGLLRSALAVAYGLGGLGAIVALASPPIRWRAFAGFLALFALVVAWWNMIEASNDRNWRPEVALLPRVTIEGDLVTVHNIRNFDYRSEEDFTPAYYDNTFDLRRLESVDLIAVYWMGPAIAHTFLSFGFAGGDYLAISIETRKEAGEGYSTLKGFFKQYELFYVVADERDVIRVRTNYRKDTPEEVYLFRLHGPIENGRRLFMEYMRRINRLKEEPEYYNTLTTNCTTTIWFNTRVNPGHLPFSWKVLLSGYVPEFLHEAGLLDPGLSLADLKRRGRINARAQAADRAVDFSRRIRSGEEPS